MARKSPEKGVRQINATVRKTTDTVRRAGRSAERRTAATIRTAVFMTLFSGIAAGCSAPSNLRKGHDPDHEKIHTEVEFSGGQSDWGEHGGYGAFEQNIAVGKTVSGKTEHEVIVGGQVSGWEQTSKLSPNGKPHEGKPFERNEVTAELIAEIRKELGDSAEMWALLGFGGRAQKWGEKSLELAAQTASVHIEGKSNPVFPWGEATAWMAEGNRVLQAESRVKLGAGGHLPSDFGIRGYGLAEWKNETNGGGKHGNREKDILSSGVGIEVELPGGFSTFLEATKTLGGDSNGKEVQGDNFWFGVKGIF